MEATELRIGNWYNSRRFNTPIKLHLEDFAEASKHADGADSLEWFDTHIDPILLTEQWLKDFGFCNRTMMFENASMIRYRMDDILIEYDINGWYCYLENNTGKEIAIRITDVHQLQTLYFSLTGKELTKSQR